VSREKPTLRNIPFNFSVGRQDSLASLKIKELEERE